MKNFVKALDKEGDAFQYLKQIFPKLSDAKLKEGISVGPQIRREKRKKFDQKLSIVELAAWKSLKIIVLEFLGNKKSRKLLKTDQEYKRKSAFAKKLSTKDLSFMCIFANK